MAPLMRKSSVSIPQRKGDPKVVSKDEGPRKESTAEKLATLRAVFRKGGVTAGNSSALNDGAAALVISSASLCRNRQHKVFAEVVNWASAGVDPTIMGIGPVPATEKLLAKSGLSADDFDAIELNEAFSAQSLAVIRSLDLDESKINQHGGAISLGHPLGCSGARILTTLMGVLKQKGGSLGLATLCVGVGQGLSVAIEME